nr:ribonuclease H-like domain-containing protein [Tanacetum cinerariifolium]
MVGRGADGGGGKFMEEMKHSYQRTFTTSFAVVSSEESHRNATFIRATKPTATAFVAKTFDDKRKFNNKNNRGSGSNTNSNNRGPNPNLKYTNCNKIGDTIDRCLELIGYLVGYVKRNFNANTKNVSSNNASASADVHSNNTLWHQRLGHPADQVLDVLKAALNLDSHSTFDHLSLHPPPRNYGLVLVVLQDILSINRVRDSATTSGCGQLKVDLEPSTWRRHECPIYTLGDYSKPSHEGYKNTIELPVGNNVVPLRSDTIRIAKLRNDILMFQQHHEESLSETWTRFKDLLKKVPHHGIDLRIQVQISYGYVNPVTRRTIDQSAGVVPTTLSIAWKILNKPLLNMPPSVPTKREIRQLQTFDTLANLGKCVCIIPLHLFKKLNIRLLEETDHIFGLADGTKSYLVGIVKDVKVHIGKLKLLNDFYVIDMKKDPETPLLVGRGFLATVDAAIDCRMAMIAVGEGITRSVFGVKRVDLGDEKAPYWTTLGKRESYKPHPSSDEVGAQSPYYARKDFLDCHLPRKWEIARDAKINPFKDVLVFIRMIEFLGVLPINLKSNMWESEDLINNPINLKNPPMNKDEAWHAKIILIDPNGEEFTKTLQSIPTTRKLSERESLREIIDLGHFYNT